MCRVSMSILGSPVEPFVRQWETQVGESQVGETQVGETQVGGDP
jgi:hypothetical protein